ncbi:DUF5682 family protein [Streptomyces sp. RFCAC02]|uniref:DUF5682 family protein n=1 Tax=Streptomyces sp. RFCAC02 TaxID=2499143 RepID=UPI00143D883D|nr:DUF5682 family protein [Streptomyces sp. RFCAC02]
MTTAESPAGTGSTRAADPGALPGTADEALRDLTDPAGPHLIGVRHHAPSLAAVMPHLLTAAAPDVLLVELPAELQESLGWLAHEETRAPVALAAVPDGGGAQDPAFYPFADFSPELVALRWAARHGVPVVAADLPLADPAWRRPPGTGAPPDGSAATRPGLRQALGARLTGRRGDDLWDRLVEVAAPGSRPEAVRRAALLTGWALRRDTLHGPGHDPLDLHRERWMRERVTEAAAGGRRVTAVVGAFHAPALTARALARHTAPDPVPPAPSTVSLIPYTYPLLDERSGYPAGIRDPEWQHLVLDAAGDPAALHDALTRTAVRVCARLRARDHPSGPADATEITRLATDLAALRGLPAPGRGELVEAVQTVLAQGEPLGRGRAVSAALEDVLVGTRTGTPAPGTPRGGLGPAVEAELTELGLPTTPAPDTGRDMRLDPARSPLDRRRDTLLRRLAVCGVPYAEERQVTGPGGTEALTTRWQIRWTPATEAMLTVASVRGVTAAQAAEGTLRERRRAELEAGGPTAEQVLTGLDLAAGCDLGPLTAERLTELRTVLPATGTLAELLTALSLLDRLTAAGRVPAGRDGIADLLTTAAIRSLPGLAGSTDPADARALVELAHRADTFGGGLRLGGELAALATDGSPLMRGAAGAVRVLLGLHTPAALGGRVASWVDAATDADTRAALTQRLTGLLTAAGPLLETAPAALEPLLGRVAEPPDPYFLSRLPALRGGFDTLSPAARDRLLRTVEERVGGSLVPLTGTDPAALEQWTRADLAARRALAALGLLPATADGPPAEAGEHGAAPGSSCAPAGVPRTPGGGEPPVPGERPAEPDGPPGRTSGRQGDEGPPHAVCGPARSATAEVPAGAGASAGPAHERLPDGDARAAVCGPSSPAAGEAPAGEEPGSFGPAGPARGRLPGAVPAARPPHGPSAPGAVVAGEVPERQETAAGDVLAGPRVLAPPDRWRLVLGRGSDRLAPAAAPFATALDELYGAGRGEGARGDLGYGRGGGREAPYPGVRAWAEELTALFGPGVREEVIAAAAAAGRGDAALALDPDHVRPSVALLHTVLRQAGGLPEARLAALRPLVRRLVDGLTRELATRLRPALTGVTLPRPSRRPGGRLDLAGTLRANLPTARRDPDGTVRIVPEHPVFRTRAARSADWRLIILTDVSGSMEPSTIWSALTAAVLAGVPALSTHFLAFSTEVVDLTGHVHDPLALLLEVRVGGGTHIAAALRHARTLITAPARTLAVVVSDFEEGYPLAGLLAETRAFAGTGAHLLGIAGLDDTGSPRYSTAVASQLVSAGMPVAALSPLELARWVGEKIR